MNIKFCPECGAPVESRNRPKANFCPECGRDLRPYHTRDIVEQKPSTPTPSLFLFVKVS